MATHGRASAAATRRTGFLSLAAVLLRAVVVVGSGAYVKERSYVGPDFFDHFWFWRWKDPTHGHVEYVEKQEALAAGLARASSDRIYIGPDLQNSSAKKPRRSVKIYSNQIFNSGLFVITLDHIPTGCGTWPAFWMTGGNTKKHWPAWGEFDIIEGVHTASRAATALHTSKGCEQSRVLAGQDFTGAWGTGRDEEMAADDCYVKAPHQWRNQGCSQLGPEGSMGHDFNARGGGTFAAQWAPRGKGIGSFAVWFWPNGTEPADLQRGQPDPAAWDQPFSYYRLDPKTCPSSHFKNMMLVFDLTFCGDMAGSNYAKECPLEAAQMTCNELVSRDPAAFKEAYWSIRRLETYQWKVHPALDAARRMVPRHPPTATATPVPAPAGHVTSRPRHFEGPGTCAIYGCGDNYRPHQKCQCNAGCFYHHNCCMDAAAVCGLQREVVARRAVGSMPTARLPPVPVQAVCTAHPGCSGLANDCCPTEAGVYLDCCEKELLQRERVMFVKRFLEQGSEVPEAVLRLSSWTLTACAFGGLVCSAVGCIVSWRTRLARPSPKVVRDVALLPIAEDDGVTPVGPDCIE